MTGKTIYDACNELTSGIDVQVIVDLGARHGEGYELFGKNHPCAAYYFVEPSDRCIPHIKEVIQKYDGRVLQLIDGVLGTYNGQTEFFQLDNDNDQSGNMFSDRHGQYGRASICKVNVHNFTDCLMWPFGIDFVKCNIEGGEYQLIEDGFFDSVKSFVMEAHNQHVSGKTYVDVLRELDKDFVLDVWGDVNYKYCYVNGTRKTKDC